MRISVISLVALSVGIQPAAADAEHSQTPTEEAQAFLDDVREGRLSKNVEVILNANGTQSYLAKKEARKILKACREGTLRWTAIPNRVGTVDLQEKTVETRFSCDGDFASYTGSAGVMLFRNEKIFRLIIQVDGFAAHFPRRAK